MLIDYAAITHVGRVRKNNEDAYLVSALDGDEPLVNGLGPMPQLCQAGILAAVADGMGGAASGEIAAREGLASIAVNLFGHWGRFPAHQASEKALLRALKHAVEEASSAILRYADTERASRGMGSTLTAAVIWKGHAYIAQVGDSRAYVFRKPRLVQITEDQTLVRQMIASGQITPEEARTHPQRSMITQALGCPVPIQAVVSRVALRRGDRLLISSDGLHGELSETFIADVLMDSPSAGLCLERLAEAALARGGRDNLTGLLLTLDDPGLAMPDPFEAVRIVEPTLPVHRDTRPTDDKPVDTRPLFDRLGRLLRRDS
jgi:protein phosphatase